MQLKYVTYQNTAPSLFIRHDGLSDAHLEARPHIPALQAHYPELFI